MNNRFTDDLEIYFPGDTIPPPTNAFDLLMMLGLINHAHSEQQAAVTEWLSKNELSPKLRDDLTYRQFDIS